MYDEFYSQQMSLFSDTFFYTFIGFVTWLDKLFNFNKIHLSILFYMVSLHNNSAYKIVATLISFLILN